ncbi:MAG: 4Fe-4S binding protein, partial [Planctomycetaceae bacterium]|nr:4Fe-4S binding protein [Planctomycetaceae bacterium]
ASEDGERALLADENWTVIRKVRLDAENKKRLPALPMADACVTANPSACTRDKSGEVWRFVKEQCFHCDEPACAESCFAKAFQKTESGAVVYYPNNCVGCRYCMLACPFHIPKFEWSKPLPAITKCMFCYTRITENEMPACISVCPTNVMKFGDKDAMLQEAKAVLTSNPAYVQHIYGETEAGGTSWIYISDVSFEELGFRKVPQYSLPKHTRPYMHWTPILGGIWGGVLAVTFAITALVHRRNKIQAAKTTNTDNTDNTEKE